MPGANPCVLHHGQPLAFRLLGPTRRRCFAVPSSPHEHTCEKLAETHGDNRMRARLSGSVSRFESVYRDALLQRYAIRRTESTTSEPCSEIARLAMVEPGREVGQRSRHPRRRSCGPTYRLASGRRRKLARRVDRGNPQRSSTILKFCDRARALDRTDCIKTAC